MSRCQLSSIDDSHWGNTQYQHDALGQIVSETRSMPSERSRKNPYQESRHFSYGTGPLTAIDKIIHHSDGLNGEPYQTQTQEKSLQYGSAGRVIKHGNTILRYDSNGRLCEKITKDNGFIPTF